MSEVKTIMVGCRSWFLRALRTWRRDEAGISAVEFALVVPLLITMFFGAVEFSQALTIDRRITAVASTAADLVAQAEEVTADELTDIFEASTTILMPYSADPISIVVSSIVADEDNDTTVDWSCAHNGSALTEDSEFAVPDGLTQAFSSVIVAQVSYDYTSPVGQFLTGSITLTDTFYLRPRRTLQVEKTDDGC